jgi:hypothetical protein
MLLNERLAEVIGRFYPLFYFVIEVQEAEAFQELVYCTVH